MKESVSQRRERIKREMGYCTAQNRPRCDACNHAKVEHGANYREVWVCTKGNFQTVATSHCKKFEPVKIGKAS